MFHDPITLKLIRRISFFRILNLATFPEPKPFHRNNRLERIFLEIGETSPFFLDKDLLHCFTGVINDGDLRSRAKDRKSGRHGM